MAPAWHLVSRDELHAGERAQLSHVLLRPHVHEAVLNLRRREGNKGEGQGDGEERRERIRMQAARKGYECPNTSFTQCRYARA